MKFTKLKINLLEGNKGQIEGLPKNPRRWTNAEIERLQRSIEETPELAEARPIIVYPLDTKYIVIGGNLRYEALKRMKVDEAYCCVLDKMSPSKLKEMVLKDNSSFGNWDADELANNWDNMPLSDWGVNVAGLSDALEYEGTNKEMDTDSWTEDMTMKFHLMADEYQWIKEYFTNKDPKTVVLNILGYGKED